jgi:flavin reductase (DIM6/NTAB) family NADH-FMN oxidoreductase RutF
VDERPGQGGMIEFDISALEPRDVYFLLTSAVVPRPIAWVSTVDAQGRPNLAPFSYFNVASTDPPILHFTTTGLKDSSRNAQETGEFVVQVVTDGLKEQMRISSADFPPEADEFEWAELETAPSKLVKPPRVAAARVAFECRLREVIRMGAGHMVFGDVVYVHVAPEVWRNDRIDMGLLQPVGRLSGMSYTTVESIYRLALPEWVQGKVDDYQVYGGAPALEDASGDPEKR